MNIPNWLLPGKRAAVCFTIDDVHPGRSSDAYEAGGDLGKGAIRHVEWLLERHPKLKITLFVTADWREINPAVTRRLAAAVPGLRDWIYLARVLPKGRMRLNRHPEFVAYVSALPRVDIGLHGLHHVRKGPRLPAEFLGRTAAECDRMVGEMMTIFREAGVSFSPGMCPPCWDLPEELASALVKHGLTFVGSARDIRTPIAPDSVTAMSGRRGVSLLYPEWISAGRNGAGRLLHMTSNFQATSSLERAFDVIEMQGLLGIKAHIIKSAFGHVALDGMDESYRNYLDVLLTELERRYGNDLWWTTMAEIAQFAGGSAECEPELTVREATHAHVD